MKKTTRKIRLIARDLDKTSDYSNEVRIENSLELLKIYNDEWIYRDQSLWDCATKMFTLSLVAILLPYLSGFMVTIPVSPFIFPFVGILISLFSFYHCMVNAYKMNIMGDTKQRILLKMKLPDTYLREEIRNKEGLKNKFSSLPTSYTLPVAMLIIQLSSAALVVVSLLTQES